MIFSIVQLFLVSFGLTYFVALAVAGLRVLTDHRRAAAISRIAGAPAPGRGSHRQCRARSPRRRVASDSRTRQMLRQISGRLTVAEERAPRAAVVIEAEEWQTYYLVPCLNEELVIGDTVRRLLADSRARVVVIDDACDDRTAELAVAVAPDRVLVVRRDLPDARQGKGPALNAGLGAVLADAGARHVPAGRIILCVMDADGRLSPGAAAAVLPKFADPEVGGVQLPVRIRNCADGLLPRLQDVLFLGLSSAFQLARVRCGTVSLGGNGQFTRLTALVNLEREPWRPSLTEDLDLSIALSADGWRITTTTDAFVSQQGLTTVRALCRQWTRWYQGHMESAKWVPRLWSSRRLSHIGMLEITLFLLVPWMLVLPWSIVFHLSLILMIGRFVNWYSTGSVGTDAIQRMVSLLLWYVLSFAPNWLVGYLYYLQDRRIGLARAIVLGHALLLTNYIAYVAAWRALYRMLSGLRGWSKTARTAETSDSSRAAPGRVAAARAAAAVYPATAPIVIPGPRTVPELAGAGAHRAQAGSRRSGGARDGGHRKPARIR
jgi:cellulose synthase/poly-beta-1,6-N-acetylglucosamine synthase-like glycosyltransferase